MLGIHEQNNHTNNKEAKTMSFCLLNNNLSSYKIEFHYYKCTAEVQGTHSKQIVKLLEKQ